MAKSNLKNVFVKAGEILAEKDAWIKARFWGENNKGKPCYCIMGACYKAANVKLIPLSDTPGPLIWSSETEADVKKRLTQARKQSRINAALVETIKELFPKRINKDDPAADDFNDRKATKHADVLKVLARAAELAA